METATRIGIVSTPERLEWEALSHEARRRGVEPLLLDLSGEAVHEEIDLVNGRFRNLDLDSMDAWFVITLGNRAPRFMRYGAESEEEWEDYYDAYHDHIMTENRNFGARAGLLLYLARRSLVVNPFPTYRFHAMKVMEMAVLLSEGYPIPPFISSNEPEALKAFIRAQGGEALYKPHVGGTMHTTFVTEEVIDDVAESLSYRPVLLQRFIRGYNVRAYVLGNDFLGAARIVHDEQYADSRVSQEDVVVVELPDELKEMSVAIARRHGMIFSGLDFQYCPEEDRYYLLEANSSPMFVNFETLSGIPVTGNLIHFLSHADPS